MQLSASGVGSTAASQPLAAFAPGLVALAAGVIAARAVPLACRGLGAAVRFSPKVGLSLALHRVARHSGVIRQSVIIAIAVSLACFAVAGLKVDQRNRSLESAFLVGANRVDHGVLARERGLRTRGAQGRSVRSARHGGRSGVELARNPARSRRVPFLTGSRLGASGGSRHAGWRRVAILDPPVAPAVTIEGGALRLRVNLLEEVTPRPSLVVNVYNEQYGAAGSIAIGPLEYGTHDYTSSLQGDCVSACRLESVGVSWAGPQGSDGYIALVIEQIEEQVGSSFDKVAAGLADRGHWRVTQSASSAPSSTASDSPGPIGRVPGRRRRD